MTQYVSYDTVGKKEDVSNIISNITPTKTPFTTMTTKETVHNTTFEWQEDKLRAAAANKKLEGFTASASARTPTTLRENVTQIMQDTFEVSGTTDAVSHYGRGKESAYQAGKAAAALKLDLEYAFVGTGQAKVKPADNNTERQFAGVQSQIASANIVYTGAGPAALSEAKYLDALEAAFDAGAEPTVTMVTPSNSRIVADFAKASGRQREIKNGASDRKIVNVVDLYVSPFGEQKIVLNRHLKAGDTLILDPSMWKRAVLKGRDWFRETLAKVGDKTSMMIVGEFSLKHMNQEASAMVREGVAP